MTAAPIHESPIALLDLASVHESPLNPRHTFDKAKLEELTSSIKASGVLQPITVRPSGEAFEIVFGTRRYRAARAAGLGQIPAIVREMDDASVIEAMLIENMQREDVHPLEEADGFQCLVRRGRSVAEVAAKVGRTEGYVYQRLKLCDLSPIARKAFADRKIAPTVALLVARIPVRKLQDEAVAEFTRSTYSIESARHYIQQNFMLRLSLATFSTESINLHPEAGACTACQKNTAVQRELFSDLPGDALCTDPSCYHQKLDRDWENREEDATRRGVKVLSPRETARVFPKGVTVPPPASGYVDLDEKNFDDAKFRTWRKLIGREAEQHVVLARGPDGRPRELVPADKARRFLKVAGHTKTTSRTKARETEDRAWRAQEDRRRQEVMRRKELVRRGLAALAMKVAEHDSSMAWGFVIEAALDGAPAEHVKAVVVDRGWDDKKKRPAEIILDHVDDLSGGELEGLGVELLLSRRADQIGSKDLGPLFVRACKDYGVDLKEIDQEVKSELAAKAEAKKKTTRTADAPPKSDASAGICRFCGCTEGGCEIKVGKMSKPCRWVSDSRRTVCTNPDCEAKYAGEKRRAP